MDSDTETIVALLMLLLFAVAMVFAIRYKISWYRKNLPCKGCGTEQRHQAVHYQEKSPMELFSLKAITYFWQCDGCGKLRPRVVGLFRKPRGRRITAKELDLYLN